jgi:hypothetical protein
MNVEKNPFTLEDLVVPESPKTTASSKSGQKAARKRGESFIQIAAAQANRLSGASVVVSVFFHLMFRSFNAFHKPFALPPSALEYADISRHAQLRAMRDLVKRGLILVDRGGPRKPPMITIIGVTKRGLRRPN